MNLGKIERAIRRHAYMKNEPAYRELLEHAQNHGDVWRVPQVEIARWWKRRQTARVELGPRLVSPLVDGVLEIDGKLHAIPVEITPGSGAPTLDATLGHEEFVTELLAHLGYGHVERVGEHPTLSADEVRPVIEALHAHALVHQRYDEEPLTRLRKMLARAHHDLGWPDVRLWTWPHREARPYRLALSTRYDVDKAIVNMPGIHEIEDRYGLRSTVYLRPMGLFYGAREIRKYAQRAGRHELALHGEFLSTVKEFGDEFGAARGERDRLAHLVGRDVAGVCMHGGELRTNTSKNTRDAVEAAGYEYETMYRNRYYLPLHVPHGDGLRRTLSIGQHYADISVGLESDFSSRLAKSFREHFDNAERAGGVFVPVMHPLYFGVGKYLRHPINAWRMSLFLPKFVLATLRMQRNQAYQNG